MKKRITMISILSAFALACCCLGIGILSFSQTDNVAYATDIVFLSDSDESVSAMQNFVAGEQIELYLGARDKKIPDEIKDKDDGKTYALNSYRIADESIAKVEGSDHTLVPLKYGLTYVTCEYANGKTYNFNIIVHNDTEFVKGVTIAGTSVSQTNFYVGDVYKLDLKMSSNCDFAQVKVTAKSIHTQDSDGKEILIPSDEFLKIESDGSLRIVGVGECIVKICSATNRNDPGVSFTVKSTIQDADVAEAIDCYFDREDTISLANAD